MKINKIRPSSLANADFINSNKPKIDAEAINGTAPRPVMEIWLIYRATTSPALKSCIAALIFFAKLRFFSPGPEFIRSQKYNLRHVQKR